MRLLLLTGSIGNSKWEKIYLTKYSRIAQISSDLHRHLSFRNILIVLFFPFVMPSNSEQVES